MRGGRGAAAVALQHGLHERVLGAGGNDGHVAEVLGGGADEGDAADVDLLDDVGLGGAGGHGLLEGVEVHDHQVNLFYVICAELVGVAGVVAAG